MSTHETCGRVCSVFLCFVASRMSYRLLTPVIRLVTEPEELLFPVMAAQCVFVGSFLHRCFSVTDYDEYMEGGLRYLCPSNFILHPSGRACVGKPFTVCASPVLTIVRME